MKSSVSVFTTLLDVILPQILGRKVLEEVGVVGKVVSCDDLTPDKHPVCGASHENQRIAARILIDARRRRLKREAEERKAQEKAQCEAVESK